MVRGSFPAVHQRWTVKRKRPRAFDPKSAGPGLNYSVYKRVKQ